MIILKFILQVISLAGTLLGLGFLVGGVFAALNPSASMNEQSGAMIFSGSLIAAPSMMCFFYI